MKIALFGGTFDPVHEGHLAVARAAVKRFALDRVYFVPADLPPHKQGVEMADYCHRFAMLALATIAEDRFVPSLLEAGNASARKPNYSIHTVRRLKSALQESDKLYFLIGIDAFMDIAKWKHPVELLSECNFIVVSRPGYSLTNVIEALPEAVRPSDELLKSLSPWHASRMVPLPSKTIYLLDKVEEEISSTQVRQAARKSVKQLSRFVPRLVAEYIKKEHLYGSGMPSSESENEDEKRPKVLSFRRERPSD
ncbi:MAG TPA: nicotinate-nucleotide adenylyltransferase [Candidatus Angelobacter sp.]|nr:nicotinate-nucleotide adenylyltransferase [Candidatus Angelobacter sp.]